MKMSNQEVLERCEALGALLQDSVPLPASISFAIIRNFKNLQPIAEDIDNQRVKIGQTYGQALDNGDFFIPEDKRETVTTELNDLLSISSSVPITTFSLDKLSGYDIPLKTMNTLYFMVEDGEV